MSDNLSCIDKALQADARSVEILWPESPTQADVEAVAAALKRLMAEQRLSGQEVGRRIGYSASAVYGFIRGTYKADRMGIARQAVHFINSAYRRSRRAQPAGVCLHGGGQGHRGADLADVELQ